MYKTAGVSAVSGTTSCRAQTFSNKVFNVPRRRSPAIRVARSFAAFVQPGHAGPQGGSHFLDGMLKVLIEQFLILRTPCLVLLDPLAGELAFLDLAKDLAHLLLGLVVHDPGTAGEIA